MMERHTDCDGKVEYNLFCDGCSNSIDEYSEMNALIDAKTELGWKSLRRRDGRYEDYCYTCVGEGKYKKAAHRELVKGVR